MRGTGPLAETMRGFALVASLLGFLLLGACTSITPGVGPVSTAADDIAEVGAGLRPLKMCLMAAAAGELLTDRIQTFDPDQVSVALGRFTLLQKAVEKVKVMSASESTTWIHADTADVSLMFTKVLADAGRSRLRKTLAGGLNIPNFLDVAKRGAVLAVKSKALVKDINSMLSAVRDGAMDEAAVWRACEERMDMNRTVLTNIAVLTVFGL